MNNCETLKFSPENEKKIRFFLNNPDFSMIDGNEYDCLWTGNVIHLKLRST